MKSIVVAFDTNRAIGRENDLPWAGEMPDDMRRFAALTRGKTVIMGRTTFESLPSKMRPLPHRQNIVLSMGMVAREGFQVAHSLEKAYGLADYDVHVIGGGQIYNLALPSVNQVFATEIQTEVEGADTFFPQLSENVWHEVERENFQADARNTYGYSFVTYLRNHPIR